MRKRYAFPFLIILLAFLLIGASYLTVKIQYDANDNPVYIGRADPGAAVTDAKWQIVRLTWDASGNCTDIQYANGSWEFKFQWSSRASYVYK